MLKKHHLFIPMRSRSRASKTDKQSVSEKTEEAVEDDPLRRGSKGSILKVRRDRSRASSRRSRRTQDVANVEESKETSAPEISRTQSRSSSKLFAFLSCCASPDIDADDTALPAKKTTKRQPTLNRLPTPDKAEAHNGDVELKDPAYFGDEKAKSTVTAAQSPQDDQKHISSGAGAQGEGPSGPSDQAPSPGSKEEHAPSAAANGAIPESNTDAHRSDVKVEGSRTTDKKPLSDGVDDSSHEENVQSSPVLPPPPPTAPPAPQVREPEQPPQRQGPQKWLLPPPLPHLQNRKCLVLDLDETLVHSSFKVSSIF